MPVNTRRASARLWYVAYNSANTRANAKGTTIISPLRRSEMLKLVRRTPRGSGPMAAPLRSPIACRASATNPPRSRPRTLAVTVIAALPPFARDRGRPLHHFDRRQSRRADTLPRGSCDRQLADRCWAGAKRLRQPHDQGKASCPSTTSPTGVPPIDCTGRAPVWAEAPYGDLALVDADPQHRLAGDLFHSQRPRPRRLSEARRRFHVPALIDSSSKSSPNSFTPRSARTPDPFHSRAFSIGCESRQALPRSISRNTSDPVAVQFRLRAGPRPLGGGFSVMNVSVSSIPIGSVATSAVPIRLHTLLTSSGRKAPKTHARFCCCHGWTRPGRFRPA